MNQKTIENPNQELGWRVTYNRRTKGNLGTGCGFFSRVASSESPKSAIRIQAPPQLAIGRGDQACPDPFQRNGGSLRRNAGTPVTLVCGNAAQPAARCLTRVGIGGGRIGTGRAPNRRTRTIDVIPSHKALVVAAARFKTSLCPTFPMFHQSWMFTK